MYHKTKWMFYLDPSEEHQGQLNNPRSQARETASVQFKSWILNRLIFFLIGWWSVALDFIDKFQSLAMQINQSDREVTFNSPLFSPLKNQPLC